MTAAKLGSAPVTSTLELRRRHFLLYDQSLFMKGPSETRTREMDLKINLHGISSGI